MDAVAEVLERKKTGLAAIAASVMAEHRVLLALVAGYVAVGGAGVRLMHQPWPFRFTNTPMLVCWGGGAVLWLASAWVRSPRALRACLEPSRVLGAVLVLALVTPIQITFQSLKQSIGPVVGYPWDGPLARLDEALHGGPAWHLVSRLVDNRTSIKTLDLLYMVWFLLLLILPLWASWTPHRALRQRALVAFVLLWVVAGTIGALVLASAGPCYSDRPEYRELMSRLDAYGFLYARNNQNGLWRAQETGQWIPLGGISAMPSLHVGFAVLLACIAWARSRWLGLVAALYAVAIQIGSVALGWHYAIDGYVGAGFGWWSWMAAGFLSTKNSEASEQR